jgi:membrane associated rhomboid family serine protease
VANRRNVERVPPRTFQTPRLPTSGPASTAPVTFALVVAALVVSLFTSVTERKTGVGSGALNFQVARVLAGEVWRLATYPFVESNPINLMISLLVLWFFGGWFERRWGGRDFIRFFALSAVGAAVLAIPLSYAVNFLGLFQDVGIAQGPGAVLDAMLVAMALTMPDSNIMFGFVLPMRARTVVLVLLGIQLVFGIMTGAAALSITLGGMAMGYLLITGRWRPQRLWDALRQLRPGRRRGLYVVPPRRDRTLH